MFQRIVFAIIVGLAGSLAAEETLVKDVAEFDEAAKWARPGDEIVLADGQWRDAKLVVRCLGEEKKPITVRPQTPGRVVFVGASTLRIGGEHVMVRDFHWKDCEAEGEVIAFRVESEWPTSSCILLGCVVSGDRPTEGDRRWVSLYGDNNAVSHCRFEGKRSAGPLLAANLGDNPPNWHYIISNFFGPRENPGKNGGEIIRIGDAKSSMKSSHTYVAFNYFYRCDGDAEIISNMSGSNTYEHNVLVGCGGALTLRHGNECRVKRNAFFGDGRKGTGGVRIVGEDHVVTENLFHGLEGEGPRAAISLMNGIPNSLFNGYFQVKYAKITGNTLVDCRQSIVIGLSDAERKNQNLPPVDCVVAENVVVTVGRPVFVAHETTGGIRQHGNFYLGGELGIEPAEAWQRLDAAPKLNFARFEFARVKVSDNSAGVEIESLYGEHEPVPISQYGPKWMKTGEEFLPAVFKENAAKVAK
jgi:poly(beta-D-mannuronate) lyase